MRNVVKKGEYGLVLIQIQSKRIALEGTILVITILGIRSALKQTTRVTLFRNIHETNDSSIGTLFR